MKTILVTGANGFVGNHLLRELNDHAVHVIAISGKQPNLATAQLAVKSLNLDLTKRADVQTIDFRKIDSVIHLAGLATVGQSFTKPLDYISTNIGIEINLFEVAILQNARPKFLIISSGTLYDPKAKLPLNENSNIIPSSPYAVSKIGQEQMAHYYGLRGFEYIIARPFNHMGPGQNEGFIVPDFAKQIAKAEKLSKSSKQVIVVGNIEAKRDYTDVRDIVRAYRLLLEKGRSGETYNVCSGKSYSGQDILSGLLANSQITPRIQQDMARMRPADVLDIYGNHLKLTKDTGWRPSIKLEQTLKDSLNDWRLRENG